MKNVCLLFVVFTLVVGFAVSQDKVTVKTPLYDKSKVETFQKVEKPISVYENSRKTLFGNRTVNTQTVVTKPVWEKTDTKVEELPKGIANTCSNGTCSNGECQSQSRRVVMPRTRSFFGRLFR